MNAHTAAQVITYALPVLALVLMAAGIHRANRQPATRAAIRTEHAAYLARRARRDQRRRLTR